MDNYLYPLFVFKKLPRPPVPRPPTICCWRLLISSSCCKHTPSKVNSCVVHFILADCLTAVAVSQNSIISRLGFFFFCELWNFGSTDLAEKTLWITTNLKLRQNSVNEILNPKAFFLPFERCYLILQYYLHTIYTFCIIYRLWRWHSWGNF